MKEKLLQFVPVETLKKIPKQKLIKIIVIVGIVAIFGIFMSENFGTVHSKQNESDGLCICSCFEKINLLILIGG